MKYIKKIGVFWKKIDFQVHLLLTFHVDSNLSLLWTKQIHNRKIVSSPLFPVKLPTCLALTLRAEKVFQLLDSLLGIEKYINDSSTFSSITYFHIFSIYDAENDILMQKMTFF